MACVGLVRARREAQFSFPEFSAYGLVALVVVTFGAAVMWQATRHRRDAREAARLSHQLVGFEAFISPMPANLRNLLRGIMAQQLFPLLWEDDEPWRQTQWPNADSLLEALRDASGASDGG
jgi:hypothetical protein